MQERSNIFDPALATACAEQLEAWEANVRPGTILNSGPTIGKLADLPEVRLSETPRAAIERIGGQLDGIMRADRPGADDTVRTSARFSIVAAEWPEVKERLTARLALP